MKGQIELLQFFLCKILNLRGEALFLTMFMLIIF